MIVKVAVQGQRGHIMKIISSFTVSILAAGIALLLAGCSLNQQALDKAIKESLLVNPAMLEKGTGNQPLYRYNDPKVDIRNYRKILIDPVIISRHASLNAKDSENYQKLVNNAYVFLTDELQKVYTLVQKPEPGTLRFQLSFITSGSFMPVRTLLSTVMPAGKEINLAMYDAAGTPVAIGNLTAELKITDAMSGELLGAVMDKRIGSIYYQNAWDSWLTADDGLKFWAKRAAFVLCEKRGDTACVKP